MAGRIPYDAYGKSGAVEDQGKPTQVTDAHIERFRQVQDNLSAGQIDQQTAEKSLTEIAGEVGKDGFAWLMRRLPMYDTQNKRWVNLSTYAKDFGQEAGVNPEGRLAKDPVGTAVDLAFGNPSSDDILGWLGFK